MAYIIHKPQPLAVSFKDLQIIQTASLLDFFQQRNVGGDDYRIAKLIYGSPRRYELSIELITENSKLLQCKFSLLPFYFSLCRSE